MKRFGDLGQPKWTPKFKEVYEELQNRGKKPHAYGNGNIRLHIKGYYYDINVYTFKWTRSDRLHEKWKEAQSLSEILDLAERWSIYSLKWREKWNTSLT